MPYLQGGCSEVSQSDVSGTEQAVSSGYERAVNESARNIPVAYDVDVVVIGGTSGGVSAAVAAAEHGARVFLAAERPYLGEDICGTYRLWLKPGEVPSLPLARKVFAEPAVPLVPHNSVDLVYEADKPFAAMHKDTQPASLLTDGKWHSASAQSVQYDGDVTIIADLGIEHKLKKVHVMAYQRRSPGLAGDFEVDRISVAVSGDKQNWKQAAVIQNERLGESLPEPWGPVVFSVPVTGRARYVKFHVRKSPDVERVLLGEIIIEDENSAAKPGEQLRMPPTLMQVKRTLDEAMLEAGVQFLYGCYATDVLRDSDGSPAGIVMANRSGRQAVKAKVIIDATPRASVARMAGADFESYPAGLQRFRRVVVGGQLQTGPGITAKKMPSPIPARVGRNYKAIEYELEIPMNDGSFESFARAEQIARDRTWDPGVVDASETLFQVPPDPIKAKKSRTGSWPGAEEVNLDVFRPRGIASMFVLGGCADISRKAAEELLRPLELMKAGKRIGAAAASQTKDMPEPRNVRLLDKPAPAVALGDVSENLGGIRSQTKTPEGISAGRRAIPVLGEYDVVIIGGGAPRPVLPQQGRGPGRLSSSTCTDSAAWERRALSANITMAI
jgi:hypothetical protein